MSISTSTPPRANLFPRLLAVLILALWTSAATLAETTERNCLPPPPNPEKARFIEVGADGADLKLMIEWDADDSLPGTAVLQLRDRRGRQVAQRVVQPKAGEVTTEILPSALSEVVDRGLEYTLELDGNLTEPYPVRVAIDCPPGQDCHFRVAGNVSAEAIVVDPDLADVLANLGAGTGDVLGAALELNPHLLGQVASLAIQLKELDDEVGIPAGECSCEWRIEVPENPDVPEWDQPDDDVRETRGVLGPGAAHQTIAQSEEDTVDVTTTGKTLINAYLDCSTLAEWDSDAIEMSFSSGSVEVDKPVLKPCEAPCTGLVLHELYFESRVTAVASDRTLDPFATPQRYAKAETFETVDYQIDGQPMLFAPLISSAVAAPGGLKEDTSLFCKTDRRYVEAPTEARLETTARLYVDGGREALARCSLSEVNSGYMMAATGFAECALDQEVYNFARQDPRQDFYPDRSNSGGGGTQSARYSTKAGLTHEPWCP